jgi:hypothetical protein
VELYTLAEKFRQRPALQFLKSLDGLDKEEDDDDQVENLDEAESKPPKMAKAGTAFDGAPRVDLVWLVDDKPQQKIG